MKLSVVTRPAAAAELESAYGWYEKQREGLGEEFLDAANHLIRVIGQHPERFPLVYRDIRRAVLQTFPYSIFYRLRGGHVIVIACFHSKRDPRKWISRR